MRLEFLIFVIMETNWKVLITSRANTNGLSLDQIETVFNSYKDPENIEFRNDHKKSAMAAYGQYPTAVWQLEKSEEMDNLFYDNMTFSVSDDVVSFSTEYEVQLTEDFERPNVVEWVEGINKIRIAYSSAGVMRLDDTLKAPIRKMLDDLVKNQTTHVSKL